MASKRTSKVRQYSFNAIWVPREGPAEMGTMFITAKNLKAAEARRWCMHMDASNPIECAGYVGPMRGSTWVREDDVRGFVSGDELERERRAEMPVVEHDPTMLAEFVARHGVQPKSGNVLKRNLLGQGVFEIEPNAPASIDPSTETYHCM